MTPRQRDLARPQGTSLFEDLFIFEMANNHQGSVEHGLRIIEAMAGIAKRRGIRARERDGSGPSDYHSRKIHSPLPRASRRPCYRPSARSL